MKTQIKSGLINSLAATGQNFGKDDQHYYIASNDCSEGASGYAVDDTPECVVPPIPVDADIAVDWIDTAAEVRRMWTIGHAKDETIVADNRYKIMIEQDDRKREGATSRPLIYAYTAPSPLTGTADERRSQIYTALVNKINNDNRNNGTAYLCTLLTGNAGADIGDLSVGDQLEQDSSGWKGYVAYVDDDWEEDDSIRLLVYTETDASSFATDEQIEIQGGEKVILDGTLTRTVGQGLMFLDDAGYYWSPSTVKRGGPSTVWQNGFSTADVAMSRDWTRAQGVGSDMAKFVPSYDPYKKDAISGDVLMSFEGDDLSTSKTYTLAIISIKHGNQVGAASQQAKESQFKYYVWADDSQNLAAFKTALNTME